MTEDKVCKCCEEKRQQAELPVRYLEMIGLLENGTECYACEWCDDGVTKLATRS